MAGSAVARSMNTLRARVYPREDACLPMLAVFGAANRQPFIDSSSVFSLSQVGSWPEPCTERLVTLSRGERNWRFDYDLRNRSHAGCDGLRRMSSVPRAMNCGGRGLHATRPYTR